jgi:hypothetical protein
MEDFTADAARYLALAVQERQERAARVRAIKDAARQGRRHLDAVASPAVVDWLRDKGFTVATATGHDNATVSW